MMNLDQINKKYNTDKGGKHCYLEKYHQPRFEPIRETTKKVLEIGVYEGASIRLWKDFFDSAHIYALEVLEKRRGMFAGDPRIDLIIGSSTDQSSYKNIPTDLDIVVDDGSHKPIDQYNTFVNAYKHLREGGIYVIEDVRDIEKLKDLMKDYSSMIKIHDFRKFGEPDTVIFEMIK